MNVYLAGKISKHDWRHGVVKGLRNVDTLSEDKKIMYGDSNCWPIIKNGIQKFVHYAGPIPTSCDHGCYHGENSHGVGADDGWDCNQGYDAGIEEVRADVFFKCENAILISDVFIAWIDTNDCYGTLVEIGMAKAMGKYIVIGGNKKFDDMWFAYKAANVVLIDPSYEPWNVVEKAIDLAYR